MKDLDFNKEYLGFKMLLIILFIIGTLFLCYRKPTPRKKWNDMNAEEQFRTLLEIVEKQQRKKWEDGF